MSRPDHDTLSQGEVYDLLSNARRRYVISYLRDRDEPVELTDLSRAVAAWENDTSVEELSDQQTKRVYVSLYQTHVPKLDDSGLVDYDQESGEIRLTSSVNELDTYLPAEEEAGVPWQLVYMAIAVVGLALYGAAALFPAAFGWLSLTLLGSVVMAAFAVVAAAHYLSARGT
ncbi:DUF7344 domain-containing protein [Halobacterium wangiae]|uniref:DUF7344 domain-containing protein n=1 Tax=Halobacterium wangiae TaxID=2902623 RepID=UPI001E5AA906|nr:hypothetical protein [Halobacterium wangiae]